MSPSAKIRMLSEIRLGHMNCFLEMKFMFEKIKIFHLLSIIERKHRIFDLDSGCRSLLDVVIQRELRGEKTVSEDLIQSSDMSRATVYRKIHFLKENGALVEVWSDHKLTYVVGANVKNFCEDIITLANA